MHQSTITPGELDWTGQIAGGLGADLRRRWPHYASDFVDGLHRKVLASTLFLFVACLANAVAFGALNGLVTGEQIGIVEMLLMTALGGIVYALFSGQPLTILGGTGPITIFTGLLFIACKQNGLPFLPVYAWVGLWSGLFLLVAALTDACALMRYFGRFTDEIFAALVSLIFIVEALKNLYYPYHEHDYTEAFLSTILALGTFLIARNLKQATQWPYVSRGFREFLSDFGPSIAITLCALFASFFPEVSLARPAVPGLISTTTPRPWLVPLNALSISQVLLCAVPAFMASILLFLDQNITTRIVNAKEHRLRKGAGYHLDLVVVAGLVIFASFLGLPWIVAATVHSVNHVKSLADCEIQKEGSGYREVLCRVRENRLSPLAIHFLMLGSLFTLDAFRHIPMAVLFGLFLYMGVSSLGGNHFYDRLLLYITDTRLYPDNHYTRNVPRAIIHKFTFCQLMCLAALWVLKNTRLGILFPLMIAALVPIRMYLSRFFDSQHFALLTAEDPEESVAIHTEV